MIISVSKLIDFFLLFPIFQTEYMGNYTVIVRISQLIRIATFLYCISLYFSGKCKISKMTIYTIILESALLVVSIFNGRHVADLWNLFLVYCTVPMVVDYYYDRVETFFNYLVVYSKIIIYGNAFSMIVFNNGISKLVNPPFPPTPMWLLGVSNSFNFWLFPMMVFLIIDYHLHSNIKSIIAIIIAGAMNILSDSTTGMVGTVLLLAFFLVPTARKVITPLRGAFIAIFLFVLIVFVGNSTLLEPIVVGVLGKDMSFTARTTIWKNALIAIAQNPLFGYGKLSPSDMTSILGRTPEKTIVAIHCHSEFLQYFFRHGLLGGAFFLFLLLNALYRCTKKGSDISMTFGMSIAITMLMGITEVFEYPLFYLLFVAAFSFEIFEKIEKKDQRGIYIR